MALTGAHDDSFFRLPDESLLTEIGATFPCRDAQIRTLATLLDPAAASCRALVAYGTEATGKSAIVHAVLAGLKSRASRDRDGPSQSHFAIVDSTECITTRHLLETTVGRVAAALSWEHVASRCETASQLTVELSKMLQQYADDPPDVRFVLVFDAIDRQRETPATLLPALARLPEIIPHLTLVFIVTSPPANFLRTAFVPHVHFPSYTKAEMVQVLAAETPPPLPGVSAEDIAELRARFYGAVHDAVVKPATRTLPAFKEACTVLWPRFTAPIVAGTHGPREFSKLLVAARVHFQNESLLDPTLVPPLETTSSAPKAKPAGKGPTASNSLPAPPALPHRALPADLAALLPTTARLLVLAAYLASHNATRHDLTLFSTYYHGRKRRGGGGGGGRGGGAAGARTKHRKIARKLLGAHAFVLERMMAVFAALRSEWEGRAAAAAVALDADVGMALATLCRLRLLVRVGVAGDLMDRGGKWRVNAGWEVVRGLGRSMGIEVEEWLME